MQTDRDLFVDGVVGRESAHLARHLARRGIARRPHAAAPGRRRRLARLPAVVGVQHRCPTRRRCPENSGTGKRVVYDRAGQRVWACRQDNVVIRSWLVSGSKYSNEIPGTHEVYSKSEVVDGVERQGLPAEDDPLATRPTSATSASTASPPTSATARRTRPRPSSAPACPAAASARPTATPTSCGTSPTSAPPSSSSDGPRTPVRHAQLVAIALSDRSLPGRWSSCC